MDIKHLTYVGGYSYEGMLDILEIMGIVHKPAIQPEMSEGYFRCSYIEVDWTGEAKLIKAIGIGKHIKSNRHYYGKYQIEPGFDMRSLDGAIRFENGFLVEKVTLRFR